MDAGKHGSAGFLARHVGQLGFHVAAGLCAKLPDWDRDGECDVPHAIFSLAVFLPDALRDDSYHGPSVVVCALFAAKADEARSMEQGAWSMERNEG